MTNAVEQSGNVTPGHLAGWVTNGVIGDLGLPQSALQVLGTLRTANFNTTSDQAIYIPASIIAFQITAISICNASVDLSTSTIPLGGFYPTVSKGGTAIVAASQSYVSLTAASKLLAATVSAGALATRYSSATMDVTAILGANYLTMYLSLSTAHGTPATADVYVSGWNCQV